MRQLNGCLTPSSISRRASSGSRRASSGRSNERRSVFGSIFL